MTAQYLSSELSNLISESKRKAPDLRNAAEKSLQDLKAIPVTSETQLAADLSRRPHFTDPFVIACNTRVGKYATNGIACLQRLAVTKAIPKERLKDVIDAIGECSSTSLEIQLKVLQTLPALLQNYSSDVKGELLFSLLQTCSSLQASKTPAVSTTAAATLQQLIISTFDKLAQEDENSRAVPTVSEVKVGDKAFPLRPLGYDAYRILHDVTALIQNGNSKYIQLSPVSVSSYLELTEAILANHSGVLRSHPEQAQVLRQSLLPFLIKSFSEKQSFPISVRVARLVLLTLRDHFVIFPAECEAMLNSLNHQLEADVALPWKRVLCMEIFRDVFADRQLVLEIQSRFNGQSGTKAIMRNCLGSFVRMASEKPALIGLSQQSTIPIGNYFQREILEDSPENPSTAQSTLSAGVSTSAVPGISQQFSSVKASCIDQLDKADPPAIPETYVYSLILSALNNLADGLAKFILPLTVHSVGKNKKKPKTAESSEEQVFESPNAEGSTGAAQRSLLKRSLSYRKKAVPENPLLKENHPAFREIQAAARLIDDSWPAILACCSTFFYAALDSEHYRALVRSYQKFAQVVGLLRMATPRDAFLTTLGKAAVPSSVLTSAFPSAGPQSAQSAGIKSLLNVERIVNQATNFLPERSRKVSNDYGTASLNTRNLLCLRALLNLAIALGPTLDSSWAIIFEIIQQAENVIAASGVKPASKEFSAAQSTQPGAENSYVQLIGSEVVAVQAAASRLFESTVDFPNDAFKHVLEALCGFLHGKRTRSSISTGTHPQGPKHQRRAPSFSGISINTEAHEQDPIFVLDKVREIASLNIERFAEYNEEESGWRYVIDEITSVIGDRSCTPSARIQAAGILNQLAKDTIASAAKDDIEHLTLVQDRSLSALSAACKDLQRFQSISTSLSVDETAFNAHRVILEALKGVLETVGDTMRHGWRTVFELIQSTFVHSEVASNEPRRGSSQPSGETITLKTVELGRIAFSCLQLICSDFLPSVPDDVLISLIESLFNFASQNEDLNISLTATHLFRDISDFFYQASSDEVIDAYAKETKATDCDDESKKCLAHVERAGQERSFPALWFHALRRTADLAADRKDDVRIAAIRTVMTLFAAEGDQLGTDTWQICLQLVWLPILSRDHASYNKLSEIAEKEMGMSKDAMALLSSKTEISATILEAIGTLVAENIVIIRSSDRFPNLWTCLIGNLRAYIMLQLPELSAAVYSSISTLIPSAVAPQTIGHDEVDQLSDLWISCFPQCLISELSAGLQSAFEKYIVLFQELYRVNPAITGPHDVDQVMSHFYTCVTKCGSTAYSSDVDSLTSLQKQIMRSLAMINSSDNGIPPALVKILAQFLALPTGSTPPVGRPSFVALSKASMDLLPILIAKHIGDADLLEKNAVLSVLNGLERPIKARYEWVVQGKQPTLGQKAMSTGVSILKEIVPQLASSDLQPSLFRKYWDAIVQIAEDLIQAQPPRSEIENRPSLYDEEESDVASFEALRVIITPALGSVSIPDTMRRSYACALFRTSLVHELTPGELPDLTSEPLDGLYNIRYGRTYNAKPTHRPKMAYCSLTELFNLVTATDGSIERVKLAQAAAPYLILRAALTLKAFIADQPLRGRMPQPRSQKNELLFILKRVAEMKSEPRAIPDAEGAKSKYRKHLLRLYPLLAKAVGVATQNPDILAALEACLRVVGDEFGL